MASKSIKQQRPKSPVYFRLRPQLERYTHTAVSIGVFLCITEYKKMLFPTPLQFIHTFWQPTDDNIRKMVTVKSDTLITCDADLSVFRYAHRQPTDTHLLCRWSGADSGDWLPPAARTLVDRLHHHLLRR